MGLTCLSKDLTSCDLCFKRGTGWSSDWPVVGTLQDKTKIELDFIMIQTETVGVEGKHADHSSPPPRLTLLLVLSRREIKIICAKG